MNENLKTLNEAYKIVKMGMDSYSVLSQKVKDEDFKKELSIEYNRYREIQDRLDKKYREFGELPTDTGISEKIMGWSGIQLNTITDKSNSHLAEMLIQGSDMGIIAAVRLLNNNIMDDDLKDSIQKLVDLQEDTIERLKPYL